MAKYIIMKASLNDVDLMFAKRVDEIPWGHLDELEIVDIVESTPYPKNRYGAPKNYAGPTLYPFPVDSEIEGD